jgi:hypothetical protein
VRDLALLLGELHGHVDRAVARDHPAEDLVLADLEDREIAPRAILVRLRKAERELRDPLLDRLQPHGRILPFWALAGGEAGYDSEAAGGADRELARRLEPRRQEVRTRRAKPARTDRRHRKRRLRT